MVSNLEVCPIVIKMKIMMKGGPEGRNPPNCPCLPPIRLFLRRKGGGIFLLGILK